MMMLIGALLMINAVTFGAFALDKEFAIAGSYRISERTLLALAFFGGSPGAILAQQLLRHKTRKEPFRSQLLAIVGLQAVAVAAIFALPFLRGAGI